MSHAKTTDDVPFGHYHSTMSFSKLHPPAPPLSVRIRMGMGNTQDT